MKHSLKNGSNSFYIIMEGIAFTVVLNLYNPFIQMFAKRMGADDIHIALLNSIPPLVAIFVLIPFSIIIEKANHKKKTTMLMIFLVSLFYAAIAFIPFIPDKTKVIVYVILIGLMNWPGALYLSTWQSFFADNFSGLEANRVYSLRSKYGAFFGLITVLLTGLVLTEIPKNDAQRFLIYQLFYVACFVISLIQLYFLSRVQERKDISQTGSNNSALLSFGRADLVDMVRNKPFVVFCACAFLFHISWQMGWPLFFIYNVDYAHLNEFQLGMTNVASGLAQFLTYSIWNRLVEKKGSRLLIIFGALGLAINPLCYTTRQSYYFILGLNIFIGIAQAGFNLTLFTNLLETLPESKKTIYTSVFNTLINISGFFSPLVGIWLYSFLSMYSSMLIIGILRFAATAVFALRWLILTRREKIEGSRVEPLDKSLGA